MKTKRLEPNDIERKVVNFGVKDNKHREIGAQITTFEVSFEQIPEDSRSWYNMAPGHYLGFDYHATRDNVLYGAIQPTKYFKTIQERNSAIDKYLGTAKKRALSSKGKQSHSDFIPLTHDKNVFPLERR